jgi:hypothetical protein
MIAFISVIVVFTEPELKGEASFLWTEPEQHFLLIYFTWQIRKIFLSRVRNRAASK